MWNISSKAKENGFSMVMHRIWKQSSGAARVYTVSDSGFSSAVDTYADYSMRYIVDGKYKRNKYSFSSGPRDQWF